ncbi:HNH endonuclease signature motif containing protein, partial [Mycolicibacterium sp.]|uniref:HNH endonuclease signature motif containing protein n=1 Tax=Mycolicibacterium sp. TaxID=2320850 RepID=UPI001A23192A
GQFLPGEIAQRAALGATITAIVHPGQAPPEQRYTPSKKLADFIRARDMTCRFPGCCAPATNCDIDHTIPWPYGPTQASNLKALCRKHHLLKTFWGGESGWQDRQLPDGTVEWTAPDGRTHLTRPGSRRLFPELCTPTAPTEVTGRVPNAHNPGLKMPRRKTTRAQDRARRIAEERELNRADADGAGYCR